VLITVRWARSKRWSVYSCNDSEPLEVGRPVHKRTRSVLLASTLVFGCDSGEDPSDSAADADAEADGTGEGEESESGEGDTDEPPADADGDGLTDEEEAELGTNPLDPDTDHDNYWDPWELTEGTDPLDPESRIYEGSWPYNPNKDELEQGSWATASKIVGRPFPRAEFLDHHGDMVDLYDFTNFPLAYGYDQPLAYFIFDLSAQWCGPCHNVANWIAGVESADTAWIQDIYPSVRDKVHSLRIWWVTFIVENSSGGPPTSADATSWFQIHHDNYIPIMVDANQQMWPSYGSNAFPHFFLLDPELKIEYFPAATDATNANPYPAVGMVEQYL
jgi:hypothetical protein